MVALAVVVAHSDARADDVTVPDIRISIGGMSERTAPFVKVSSSELSAAATVQSSAGSAGTGVGVDAVVSGWLHRGTAECVHSYYTSIDVRAHAGDDGAPFQLAHYGKACANLRVIVPSRFTHIVEVGVAPRLSDRPWVRALPYSRFGGGFGFGVRIDNWNLEVFDADSEVTYVRQDGTSFVEMDTRLALARHTKQAVEGSPAIIDILGGRYAGITSPDDVHYARVFEGWPVRFQSHRVEELTVDLEVGWSLATITAPDPTDAMPNRTDTLQRRDTLAGQLSVEDASGTYPYGVTLTRRWYPSMAEIMLDERLTAHVTVPLLRRPLTVRGFGAHTTIVSAEAGDDRSELTSGVGAELAFELGRYRLSVDAETAYSYYATLDGDGEPRAGIVARLTLGIGWIVASSGQ